MKHIFLVLVAGFLISPALFANQAPQVGRGAAAKYFSPAREPNQSQSQFVGGSSDRVLSLHFGKFMDSQAYEWGRTGRENQVGGFQAGVTYRLGEWVNSMDLNLRVDYHEFDVLGEQTSKISIMPLITFPDAASRFPLYFGFGGGLGVFFNQVQKKSPLSFDYQLILGARFFDVFERTGFFVEGGLKNHLHLLTTGQFNGSFLTFGAVFTF
jgi:hypothetical protein